MSHARLTIDYWHIQENQICAKTLVNAIFYVDIPPEDEIPAIKSAESPKEIIKNIKFVQKSLNTKKSATSIKCKITKHKTPPNDEKTSFFQSSGMLKRRKHRNH